MEKKLLSKLGNYFQKGVKIGVLSAALLSGVGCAVDADGGSSKDNTQQGQTNQDQNYYYFLKHPFMEANATISSSDSEAAQVAWANKHFNDARDYMKQKIADYKTRLEHETTNDNFLKPLFDRYSANNAGNFTDGFNSSLVDDALGFTVNVYSNLVGAIKAKYVMHANNNLTGAERQKNFDAHYTVLGLRTYNDSLGVLRNSDTLPFNQERDEINASLQEIVDRSNSTASRGLVSAGPEGSNGTYTANDYDRVEAALYEMLQVVSRESGVTMQTLVDTLNLSFLTTGLWGARDLGVQKAALQLSSRPTKQRPNYTLPKLNSEEYLSNIFIGYLNQINIEQSKQSQQQAELTK